MQRTLLIKYYIDEQFLSASVDLFGVYKNYTVVTFKNLICTGLEE